MSDIIRVQAHLQLPQQGVDGKAIGQALQRSASGLVQAFPQSELWEITEKHDRCRYTVRNPLGRIMRKVQAVGPSANRLQVGQIAIVGYYDRDRRRPYIKAAGGFADWGSGIALALWSQGEGTCYLSNSVISPVIAANGFNSLWTGTSVTGARPLGLVVDIDSRMVTAQAHRDPANTIWETLKLSIIPADTLIPEEFSCLMATSPSSLARTDGIWTNSDASLVLVAEFEGAQLFRKRGTAWAQITLTDVGSLSLDGINMSPLGHVLFSQTDPAWPSDSVDSGGAVTLGTQTNAGAEKMACWAINVAATTIPRTWTLDPATLLSSQFIVNARAALRVPCGPLADQFAVWVSGRARLPHTTNANKSLLRNYDPSPVVAHGLDTDYSRQLEAVIAGISTAGSLLWRHVITLAASAASEDSGLLNPLTAWLTANVAVVGAAGNTCDGRYTADEIVCDSASTGAGFNDIFLGPYGDAGQTFQVPQYDYFRGVSLVALPLEEPNNAQPRDVLGSLNNMAVFTDYAKDVANQGRIQRAGLVGDSEGNFYIAYLAPSPILVSGAATYAPSGGGTPLSLGLSNLSTLSILERLGGGNFHGNHVPNVEFTWRRYLRKIDKRGNLLAEADMTQTATASWYEDENALGSPTGSPVAIGGDSSQPLALGDNNWSIVPIGRVVFLLTDYHDLGPNFYPATKLVIKDSSSLATLHTIELRLNEDVIGSDILDGGSNIVFRAGEREYSLLPADCKVKAGVTPEDLEFAAIWINQVQRVTETPDPIPQRLMILQMGANLADAPSTSQADNAIDPASAAIVAGRVLDITYNANWQIRQMV